jgi:hypothetical protein
MAAMMIADIHPKRRAVRRLAAIWSTAAAAMPTSVDVNTDHAIHKVIGHLHGLGR